MVDICHVSEAAREFVHMIFPHHCIMVSEAYADMKLVNAMINFAWFILPCILQYIFSIRDRLDPFILKELESTQWIRLFDLEFDIPRLSQAHK